VSQDVIETKHALTPAAQRWTTDGMTVIAPAAYAALYNLNFRTDETPFDGPDGLMIFALFGLKLLTVVSLMIGLHRIGARIAASPAFAWVAGVVWALVGVALVAVVALAKNRGASVGVDHLWPGQSGAELIGHLDPQPGLRWTPTNIVTAEMVAVVMLAVVVALMLRLVGQRLQRQLVTGLTMVVFLCGLLAYDQVVGWPVMFDFDPFVGDAVLGALTYELALLPAPIDPVGAITLATIAAANGLILMTASRVTPRSSRQPE
jgi:hypothetical protein